MTDELLTSFPLEIIPHKTLVFQDMIPPSRDGFVTTNHSKASGWWMPYKFSKGDSVFFASTRHLHYIADVDLLKFHQNTTTFSSLFPLAYSRDLANVDFKDEEPNTEMIYLGFQASVVSTKTKYYKFLDVQACKIKWIDINEIQAKLNNAFAKNARNKIKLALEKKSK